MPVSTRKYHLEILSGGVSQASGTYGSGVYGAQDASYGVVEGEAVLTADRYKMLPSPGWSPSRIGWVFRIGDELKPFGTFITSVDDSLDVLDLSTLQIGTLIMRKADIKGPDDLLYEFTLSKTARPGELTYAWQDGDLATPGLFNAYVRMVFNTGRQLTIDAGEGPYIEVVN